MDGPDPIIYAPQLSAMLGGVPLATIRFWTYNGTGPRSFKIGRKRAWRQSEVQRWLTEQENKADA